VNIIKATESEITKAKERRKWFLSHIGKYIYRNRTTCPCKVCESVYKEGLFVYDMNTANNAYDYESEASFDGIKLKYFATIEERDEYEKNILTLL
jgi:hypothetical protein